MADAQNVCIKPTDDEPTEEGRTPSMESIPGVTDLTQLFTEEATPQSQTITPTTIPHQTEPRLSPNPSLTSRHKEDQNPPPPIEAMPLVKPFQVLMFDLKGIDALLIGMVFHSKDHLHCPMVP